MVDKKEGGSNGTKAREETFKVKPLRSSLVAQQVKDSVLSLVAQVLSLPRNLHML